MGKIISRHYLIFKLKNLSIIIEKDGPTKKHITAFKKISNQQKKTF